MKGVPFPAGQEAYRVAFFKTLDHISLLIETPAFLEAIKTGSRPAADELKSRRDELARVNTFRELDEEAWECLRAVLRSDAAMKAVEAAGRPAAEAAPAGDGLGLAVADIAAEMTTRFPAGRIRDAEGVRQTLSQWLIPWVLFHTVIPLGHRGS